MSETVTELALHRAAAACSDAFRHIVAHLRAAQPETTKFALVWAAWTVYYFEVFAQFDVLLKKYIDRGENNYQRFLPISISHHNLHRLTEVLYLEIGGGTLSNTRIPERIIDLIEVCNRLEALLEETNGADAIRMVPQRPVPYATTIKEVDMAEHG